MNLNGPFDCLDKSIYWNINLMHVVKISGKDICFSLTCAFERHTNNF